MNCLDGCNSLAAKMDAWADSMGAALGHQSATARYHAPAAPEGEVLAVAVTITDKARPKNRLAISVANWNGAQYATDWIEYDIAFRPNTPNRHPDFLTLVNSATANELRPCDRRVAMDEIRQALGLGQ